MELYIVRHGTTVWNEQKRTQGRVNNRLSAKGKQESQELAEELMHKSIDYIFCSPLMRAVQTANIINQYHKQKIVKDKRLTDIDQGVFSGRYFLQLSTEELEAKRSRSKAYGMESLREMYLRVKDFFEYLLKNFSTKTVLVVTHSGVASFLQKMTLNSEYSLESFGKTALFGNAQIKHFVL